LRDFAMARVMTAVCAQGRGAAARLSGPAEELPAAATPTEGKALKTPICPASAVANGCSLKVEREGLSLCVFNLDGSFYVTDDTCTHGPGSLSEGAILDDIVECNFHGGAFNIRTGAVEAPPCMQPLRTYAVELVDGTVCVDPALGRSTG
jgi:nitrite reductase/ring-hydroxylating ferredoxin subunit